MFAGNEFHAEGPATVKERSPNLERVRGMSSRWRGTLADVSSNCFVFICLQQNCLTCGRIVRTHSWRRLLHSLTAVLIIFCFRLIQTSPVTSWIHKHSWTSSGRHTAAQQSNLVKNWLLGPQIWTDKNYWRFFHALQHVFCLVGFPEVVQTDVGRGGNLNSHSIASCVINTTAKNYINLIIFLQVMINNVADVFSRFFV